MIILISYAFVKKHPNEFYVIIVNIEQPMYDTTHVFETEYLKNHLEPYH